MVLFVMAKKTPGNHLEVGNGLSNFCHIHNIEILES